MWQRVELIKGYCYHFSNHFEYLQQITRFPVSLKTGQVEKFVAIRGWSNGGLIISTHACSEHSSKSLLNCLKPQYTEGERGFKWGLKTVIPYSNIGRTWALFKPDWTFWKYLLREKGGGGGVFKQILVSMQWKASEIFRATCNAFCVAAFCVASKKRTVLKESSEVYSAVGVQFGAEDRNRSSRL